MKKTAMVMAASALVLGAVQANAAEQGKVIGTANTAALVTLATPAAYAGMGGIFLLMVGGCEIVYKAGSSCASTPRPTPLLGYNQLHGLAPRPDGTIKEGN